MRTTSAARPSRALAAFFFAGCILIGCSSKDTTISDTGFDKSCVKDADCVLVGTGSVCGDCNCTIDAINQAALASFNAEVEAKQSNCSSPLSKECDCAGFPPAICANGQCAEK